MNEMNRTIVKLLEQRAKLALGSLALVDKELSEICLALDNQLKEVYDETIRGEEEKSEFQSDFFIRPPTDVYEEHS